jgi:hypothetical protein
VRPNIPSRFGRTWIPPVGGLFLFPVLLLNGCVTWSKHGIAPHPPEKVRVAVLPVQIAVTVKHLKNIETIAKSEKAPPNEKDLIQQKMRQVANDITRDLEAKLSASYFFEVVPDTDVRRAMDAAGIVSSTEALTRAQITDLGKALGAQVVLSTKLSGYGNVKKRWLFYLIGSGLVEGVVQGAVVAAAVGNPWIAVGIGTEEMASETITWGGGAYLFGRIFSPVILEGQLVSVADGRTVWSGTALATGNRKAVKALPKADRMIREIRLRLTAQKVAADLVKKIDKKAWANLKNADERPPMPR